MNLGGQIFESRDHDSHVRLSYQSRNLYILSLDALLALFVGYITIHRQRQFIADQRLSIAAADMSASATSNAFRRSCSQLSSTTQKRSLSSQCLRISASRQSRELRDQRRWQTTDASAAATNPKISSIVDQISTLTLLETADLVQSLKVRTSKAHRLLQR